MKNKILFLIILSLYVSSQLLAVDWDDCLWFETKITPDSLAATYWLEFYFLPDNPKYGYACGTYGEMNEYGVFAKTTDSGNTWTASIVSSNMHAESVHFVDTNVGYVGGTDRLYKTIDGGQTWKRLNVVDSRKDYMTNCWGNFAIDNTVWVLEGSCSPNGLQRFWKSIDGGTSWNYFTGHCPYGSVTDMLMLEKDGLGFAVGSGALWKTTNGGNSWNIIAETPTFNWVSSSTHNNWHEDLAVYNQSILVPIAPNCSGNGTGGAIAFSPDMGKNWNTFFSKSTMFGSFLVNDSSGWACGTDGELYYTTNYGKKWTKMICGIRAHSNFDDLYFINDSVGFVTGDGGIHKLIKRSDTIAIASTIKDCQNSIIVLSTADMFNYYEWYKIVGKDTILVEKTAGNSVSVYNTGIYIVKGLNYNCNTVTSKELNVTVPIKPDVFITTDKSYYCFGDSATITAIITFERGRLLGMVEDIDFVLNGKSVNNWEYVAEDSSFICKVTIYDIDNIDISGYLYWIDHQSGCYDTIRFKLDISPKIKPILIPSGNLAFCANDTMTIRLANSNDYEQIEWFKDGKLIATNVSTIDVSNSSGYFYVIANVDKGRCPENSDTLKVIIINDSNRIDISAVDIPFFVDSVVFGSQSFRYLKLKNKSSEPFTIHNVGFKKKFAFTTPMNQFPITIPPYDTALILICYTPTDLDIQFDTMYIYDSCGSHIIPISGVGKKNIGSANALCNTVVTITTKNINANEVIVNAYDILGKEINIAYKFSDGDIIFDLENLTYGIYFVRVKYEEEQMFLILNK